MTVTSTRIHPTAVVDPNAQLADDVVVGPYCVIGPKVSIGAGTRLWNHVHLEGRTTLGRGNRIYPFTSLGSEPQDLKYVGEDTELVIGDENTIRESVTINIGTAVGGGITTIGSHNLLMACTHMAHDCTLEDHIAVTNGALLGGHVKVQSYAIISGGALVHHFVTIGKHAFLAGGAHVNTDVPPYMMIHGSRQRVQSVNTVGLKRHGFSKEAIDALRDAHRIIWRSGLVRNEALRRLERDFPGIPEIAELIASLKASLGGKNGRALEATRNA